MRTEKSDRSTVVAPYDDGRRKYRYPKVYHLTDSLDRYANQRVPTGGFLRAVLENDLKESCARADDHNQRLIWEIVEYCWNELPATCWGSPERVAAWLEEPQ